MKTWIPFLTLRHVFVFDLVFVFSFVFDLKSLKPKLFLEMNIQGLDGAFLGPSDLSISLGVPTDLGLPKCQYTLVLSLSKSQFLLTTLIFEALL